MHVSRLSALGVLGTSALVLSAASAGALEVRLTVKPVSPHALEPATIELRASADALGGLRIQAVSPRGNALRVRTTRIREGLRRGGFRFTMEGRWQVLVTDSAGRRVPGAQPRVVRVRAPMPTPPPSGFGPLGKPGCDPPSPRDPSTRGFVDVFGSAVGGEELWALPFLPAGATWASRDAAIFDGLAGMEVKIVFAMTFGYFAPFRAVGLDGTAITPVWGPSFHVGSNWGHPGAEWGAGFVFPAPGCWRIEVGPRGNVWLLLRS